MKTSNKALKSQERTVKLVAFSVALTAMFLMFYIPSLLTSM